jgi:hypothetical protein
VQRQVQRPRGLGDRTTDDLALESVAQDRDRSIEGSVRAARTLPVGGIEDLVQVAPFGEAANTRRGPVRTDPPIRIEGRSDPLLRLRVLRPARESRRRALGACPSNPDGRVPGAEGRTGVAAASFVTRRRRYSGIAFLLAPRLRRASPVRAAVGITRTRS